MDSREISARLHDVLRAACRVRAPGPGCTAEASVESIDQVKARLRAMIADLGEQEPPRLPPRLQANAADFPEGRIAGTRAVVQHRRRTRGSGLGSHADASRDARRPATPAMAAAMAIFAKRAATHDVKC